MYMVLGWSAAALWLKSYQYQYKTKVNGIIKTNWLDTSHATHGSQNEASFLNEVMTCPLSHR